jgi:hypothetical protein
MSQKVMSLSGYELECNGVPPNNLYIVNGQGPVMFRGKPAEKVRCCECRSEGNDYNISPEAAWVCDACVTIKSLLGKIENMEDRLDRWHKRIDHANEVIRRFRRQMPEECFNRYFNVIANGKETSGCEPTKCPVCGTFASPKEAE